jgi:hypothetical protein
MDLLNYQRTVFAFHGCDRRVCDSVLSGNASLAASENTYDWLGRGIYFWEHGPQRAYEWAVQQSRRKASHITTPAVIGAVIQLGNCFDLLDTRFTGELTDRAGDIITDMQKAGHSIPANRRSRQDDFDWMRREGDCFLLNTVVPQVEEAWNCDFHTVRGVFQEGRAVVPGSGIRCKSHIQIAVRHPSAIVGYFLPPLSAIIRQP